MYELVCNHGVDTSTNGSHLDAWTPPWGYQIENSFPMLSFVQFCSHYYSVMLLCMCAIVFIENIGPCWSRRAGRRGHSYRRTQGHHPGLRGDLCVTLYISLHRSGLFSMLFFDLALADYRRGNHPGRLLLISTVSLYSSSFAFYSRFDCR